MSATPTANRTGKSVRSILRSPLRALDRVYRAINLRTDGFFFCTLFNLHAAMRAKTVRISFDPQRRRYCARDGAMARHFFAKFQNHRSYRHGMAARARDMGDAYFLDLVSFRDGDRVVDCGANVGDLKLWFDLNAKDIEYVGVEPAPLEFECLSENVAPAQALNLGLWNTESTLEFYISSRNADSSFFRPETFTDKRQVPTQRLDQLIEGPIRLLKLEAEGAEPEVLEGCGALLDSIDYISADLGFERGPEQESTLPAVANFLLVRGFEIVTFRQGRIVVLFRRINLQARDV